MLPAELRENEENLVPHLEIPGMDPDRFEIEIFDDHLVVRAEKRVDAEQCSGRYFLLERAYGSLRAVVSSPGRKWIEPESVQLINAAY